MKYDVVAIGELLIDFTTEHSQKDGYPVMAAHPGGAPTNYLAALAKYGRSTALVAKLGDDAFGRMLRETVRSAGISDQAICVTENAFTTLAFVTRDESGERSFSFARKPGADMLLKEEEIPLELLEQTEVVHFGTVSMTDEPARSTHRAVIPKVREMGKLISFDPNLREPLWKDLKEAKEQMLWGISQTDVLKISDYEVEFLYGCSPEEGAEKILRDSPVQLVFVTLGKDGCYFANRKASGHVPGLTGLNVVDTTGAGDIFGGSAMYGILSSGKAPGELEEEELRKITRFACTAAGLSTTHVGGIPSVPDIEEVMARLK